MTMDYALLISLLICHFVADYGLTTPAMIEAKATGKRMIHIVLHAGIHTVLMGGVLIVFGATIYITSMLVLLELLSHFLIDYGKGWIGRRFPSCGDNKQKAFWVLYGFDQLLHLLVIVLIVKMCDV